MKKLCLCLTGLLVLLSVLSGCQNAQPSDSQPQETMAADNDRSVIEPEQLISQSEAAQLVGEAVGEGEKTDNPAVGQKMCRYDAENTDSLRSIQVSLTQQAYMENGNNTPQDIYLTTKDAVDETADGQTVDGVGSEYFFGTPGLHILYREYYIVIAAGNTSDPQVLTILAQAGTLACTNLDALLDP